VSPVTAILDSVRFMNIRRVLILALAALSIVAPFRAESPSAYRVVQKIRVGGDGGWDYLTVDSAARRLYITRATRVMVFDADSLAPIGEVANTTGVHGVAIAPEFGRGFTSNGRANSVTIFDLKTLKPIDEVNVTGENPDAILYDGASKRVFAFNGRSADVTILDAASAKVIGTVALGGKPEFAATDLEGHVYVNIEDKSEVAVLDARKASVLQRWPLTPCEEPSGMAIDRRSGRLFIGCGNKKMAIVDTATGKVVAIVPIGDGVDANGFDPRTNLAFSSNRDGTLTVVEEKSPSKFVVVDNVPTQLGARTMALDEKTHRVFLVTADFEATPPATADQPHPRPPMKPDSFTILVVDR
jgi:YVTN family beta-propeller protein